MKSRVNPDGMAERRALLATRGYDPAFLAAKPPRGAADDDRLDAAVCALVAERILAGEAVAHPAEPIHDAHGIRIAIWA